MRMSTSGRSFVLGSRLSNASRQTQQRRILQFLWFRCGGRFMNEASMRVFRTLQILCLGLILALIVSGRAEADKIKHPIAVFAGLDKITGRTIAFEAATGETVQFGSLQITERACYARPATEAPQTTTFIEVDEVDANNNYKRIFSGWMFAASPGLHGIEHPIYDIWLTDCKGGGEVVVTVPEAPAEAEPPPPETPKAAEKPARRQRRAQPSENAVPPDAEQLGEPLPEPSRASPPRSSGPIEVGPPPGLIPMPQGGRRQPAQRYYPADPGPPREPDVDGN
jgi:hypothetical protein